CMLRGMDSDEVPHALAPEQAPDTRALGRSLIDALGAGWSRANVDQIMAVFAPEAVFIETPFSEALRGTQAIRRWWLDVPYSQSEITFSSGEIYAAGPWFSTEFKCVFRRKRTGEWVDARGAIFCETAGGLISEMRFYWHRWNGGRETSKP
ncbi:MAG TPA: nuclear transport factor 2 family protein, partial [Gemmatimonadales bacterium]|nr:nuclear transport factor 2 family protein [Gemmatimonadales bacterium]